MGGPQVPIQPFELDQDITKTQSIWAHGTTSLQEYCQQLVRNYNETNNAKWLELRRSLLQQHINRFQSLITFGELCKNGLQHDLELHVEAPTVPPTPYTSPERSIEPSHQNPVSTSRSHIARSGGLDQPVSRDQYLSKRMSYTRDHQGQILFTLENPSYPPGSSRFWDYVHDKNGILWYYGQSEGATKTGYIINATRQNLEVIEKAYGYLVDYKDTLVREVAQLKDLRLAERRRDA
ncbi:hypothetical protein F4818DRAFT_402191 [Hypoxylon cercidicola]|nr:hypothetical protein F4818DRAFT_402191 [Hypoxylon cercidicola]